MKDPIEDAGAKNHLSNAVFLLPEGGRNWSLWGMYQSAVKTNPLKR
jgi:hypothetical protein